MGQQTLAELDATHFRRAWLNCVGSADAAGKQAVDGGLYPSAHDAAADIFETAKRSLDHSPKLMARTFRDMRPITVDGNETGAFSIDLVRHKNVMSAIAHAIYFLDKGRKHRGHWLIFTPSFGYAPSVLDGQPDPWKGLRQYLDSGQYTPISVSHPDVFKCEMLDMEENQTMRNSNTH